MLLARREIKKMPRFKQNLGWFEKRDLKKKGILDGTEGNFEGSDVFVEGMAKTIYNSSVVMEEMAKFCTVRSQLYSGSYFDQSKSTFRELIHNLERQNNELEMNLGFMSDVDTKNYRTAQSELLDENLDENRRKLHELTINNLESKVYNETKARYGSLIINLEEEVRLLEAFYEKVNNYFNRTQERISYYWNFAKQKMETLPVIPPTEWELLALKRETRYGEMEGMLEQKRADIQWYQARKDTLVPEGIIQRFLTNEGVS